VGHHGLVGVIQEFGGVSPSLAFLLYLRKNNIYRITQNIYFYTVPFSDDRVKIYQCKIIDNYQAK
jgi:hypothetical protein